MWTELANQMIKALGGDSNRLKQILDVFPLGVIMTNSDDLITYYNQAHAKLDGLEPEQVMGRPEVEVLAPIVGPNIMSICQKTAQPILGYIFPYRTIKGNVVNAAYWVFPVFENRKVVGAVCFTQPLLSELKEGRAYSCPPIQWPGSVPINLPVNNIVGLNPAFRKAVGMVRVSAGSPFPVLISGETGSGKEMFAKLVHEASPRRKKPYLALNCSAIPGQLLEGLLFGTAKGSFTGAIDRAGLFEEANGGTIYLDELDSMPLELQPKLLRALQEMSISRVGSSQPINLDLKLISSIGSAPQQALEEGRLRADLFYRLAVVVINIPPLRERMDDLELLAEHFICKYNNILGKSALKIDDALLRRMRSYHWPGNVRELEHLIAGAVNLAPQDGYVLGLEHIPEHYSHIFSSDAPDEPAVTAAAAHQAAKAGPIRQLMLEEQTLKELLQSTKGNLSQAAKQLGISRQLLSYRLRKFGLKRHDYK